MLPFQYRFMGSSDAAEGTHGWNLGAGTVIALLLGACASVEGRDAGDALRAPPAAVKATPNRSTETPSSMEASSVRSVPALESAHGISDAPSPGPSTSPRDPVPDPWSGLERSYLLPVDDGNHARKSLAFRNANLSSAACRAEVRRRRISAVGASGAAPGIASPMRLRGPIRDVRFVAPGSKSVHGMLDCRLVLLLDDLAPLLADAGVAVVYVDGFYRPRAHLPGSKSPSQHSFGLAIDIHGFGTKDGRLLDIQRDFAGQIGAPVCGPDAALTPPSREAIELRNVVCAIARSRAFHYLLTPNHDASHANHLHGDIKRGSKHHVVR